MRKSGRTKAATGDDDVGEGQSLLEISRKVSATIGTDFFYAVAKHLAEALAADCVMVAEFTGGQMERCRSVGAWCDGARANFEYELAGSATAQIALGKPCQWRSQAKNRFPSDTLLSTIGAEACVGVPLSAGGTQVLGALMALYRRPATSLQLPKAMLEIFAERAAVELARRLEEERLRESEQRYRAFIAKNVDAMWRVEFEQPIPTNLPEEEQLDRIYKHGYVAECNDALARLVGLERWEQLVGARLSEIAPVDDPASRRATMVAIRSGYRLTTVETNPVDGQGKRRWMLRSQWGIVEDGHLERIWGAHRDITELRHVEMALDAAEQRMADLLESMRLLVVLLDPSGLIEFCNNYLYQLTGWSPADLIGKDWLATMIPDDEQSRVRAELDRCALALDQPVHFESTLLAKDGSRLQLAWDSTDLRSTDGRTAARAIIGRDVTEQKALEEQFRQAQKLAGIGRLAGGLAHDFNNLLTVILGYTTGLLDKLTPSDPVYVSLAEVQRASERGAELAHRLLTFSRRQVFRPQVIDLNRVVQEAEGLLRALAGKDVQLVTQLEAGLRMVRADPTHLHQILMNLASNARDAMPQGGTLTIATSNSDVAADHSRPAGIPPGEYVLLTVADTGTGMTEEVKSHLFEPFFTTKEASKGTGLGLATVYGIVQESVGHIRVDTEPGRGTIFRIFLPRAYPPEMPKESSGERVIWHGNHPAGGRPA